VSSLASRWRAGSQGTSTIHPAIAVNCSEVYFAVGREFEKQGSANLFCRFAAFCSDGRKHRGPTKQVRGATGLDANPTT
jgi:hypothetical protein